MAETFVKSDGTEAGSRTYLRGLPKSRRSASRADRWGNREKWSVASRIGRDIRRFGVSKSPETFVDFVDKVRTSPETFLQSDGTEAGSRTYLRGWPKSRRQAS